VTLPFCVTSMLAPDVGAGFGEFFSEVLAGIFDADSAAGFAGFTGGKSFVGPGAGALARATSSAVVELP
jgi:hypothetical protein